MKHLWLVKCEVPGYETGWHSHICECGDNNLNNNFFYESRLRDRNAMLEIGHSKLITEAEMFELFLKDERVDLRDNSWWADFWKSHDKFYGKFYGTRSTRKCLCHPVGVWV